MEEKPYSILFPFFEEAKYRELSEVTCHDLGLDALVKIIAGKPEEQRLIYDVLSHMTDDPRVANYRKEIFRDIRENPGVRKKMMELFDRIEFIRNFGSMHKTTDDEIGLWHLYQRLDELKDYIRCVEEMHDCLTEAPIRSEGLTGLRDYVDTLYQDARFEAMKKDIDGLTVKASDIQSITIGINLNERLEATGLGLISINDKPFKKSRSFSHFSDAIRSSDRLNTEEDWDGDMHFQPAGVGGHEKFFQSLKTGAGFFNLQQTPFVDARTRSTIVNGAMDESGKNTAFYLENVMGRMMSSLSKNLRDTLTAYGRRRAIFPCRDRAA